MDPDLDGRVALVTGSAKGLGRAFALALADCGADVCVHYNTSDDAAAETADDAREKGVAAMAASADVTDPADVDGLFDRVESRLGGVDVLVNNVGNFAPTHWEDIEWSRWQTVVETNYYGTVLCAKRALPGMRDREWGRVVNVGYASAEKGLVSPKNFPYFAAKNSVLMFTRMLAADTQDDGVTVNAVSPYVVESSDEFPEEAPRGRWARYEDVVAPLLFFCSEEAAYVSGENVEVDGGWLPEDV
ncbi:SDR family NAD(P)-dependent oxidoreductase [Halorarius halobius]|uniref:SDR family NAD(P)-dependent oxidoreductase n=1 Tax=Halorarius halobius TaxID=2962671 RepID=UPI0020CFCF4D|nr:SDR family oxidoreductase [Halorarius halobius]